MADKEYRYIGTYAHSIASGQPVAPGEFVTLSAEDEEENAYLLENNFLLDTSGEEEPGKGKPKAATSKKEG